MEPRIEEKQEIRIVGCASLGGDIGELWQAYEANEGDIEHSVPDSYWELHIYPEGFTGKEKYHIVVGKEVSTFGHVPITMVMKCAPAGTYAVFTHRLGDGGWEGSNERISTWMAESKEFTRAHPMDIQHLDSRFKGPDDPESILEFYIPIRRRE